MAVDEGHVLNIDAASAVSNGASNGGKGSPATAANKYKSSDHRAVSGVGRGGTTGGNFLTLQTEPSDMEEGATANNPLTADRVSVLSGASGRSKTTSQLEAASKLPWYRGVTCKDIKDITPTVLILLGGLLIMIFVIPYAFSSVIKQLEAEEMLEKARAAAKEAAKTSSTTASTPTSTVMSLIQTAVTPSSTDV